ncbi:MAG: phenylalanine--tRNA ligase beta subunit-related protein [Deferrisomatales bacterium]
MTRFRYAPEILERYPALRGGVLWARGVRGGPTPGPLAERFRAEQRAVRDRLGQTPLSEVESLAAWRQAFRGFGVNPTRYRSAAEALLRRLTKKGDIPCVNLLVDLGNLVSIRYALPVAVLDLRQVAGAVTVGFAAGDEPFTELDSSEVHHPEPGEVIFTDEARTVHARRWCWRQSAQSAAREDTSEILITMEAHHPAAEAEVGAAVADLGALLDRFAGGERRAAVLSPARPRFAAP